ncbi:MAG: CXXX repeat peptide maturase [Allobaculum sp.]|nr:CXXX repeat peptide maturase [Allobaculum sp.]
MKENLTLQFLYPNYTIPKEYKKEIAQTFHADIVSYACEDNELRKNADIVVFDQYTSITSFTFNKAQAYVFRTTMAEMIANAQLLFSILPKVNRISIVLTDVMSFKKEDESKYAEFLNSLSNKIVDEYKGAHEIQINLLTDRILLDRMNNCNAGYETITLCPDGNYYVCSAFYSDGDTQFILGHCKNGLDIKNPQLYRLDHAPICKICDAYQCRRCVWLNNKSTHEVNTPSREQCVIAHLERNASERLLKSIREIGDFLPEKNISEIDYLDPFDKLTK